jgi:hypothetical protein
MLRLAIHRGSSSIYLKRSLILHRTYAVASAAPTQTNASGQKLYKVREALNQALFEELERDENVIVIGKCAKPVFKC